MSKPSRAMSNDAESVPGLPKGVIGALGGDMESAFTLPALPIRIQRGSCSPRRSNRHTAATEGVGTKRRGMW